MNFVRYAVVACATLLMTVFSLIQVDRIEAAIAVLEILTVVYLFFIFVCVVAKRYWRKES